MSSPNPPAKSELRTILRDSIEYFNSLVDFIERSYQVVAEPKYSKKSGWTYFYKNNGRSLCYINIKEGGFTVTVVIGASLNRDIQKLSISAQAKKMYYNAWQYHDGKWLHFDVSNNQDIKDIQTLLIFKKKSVKVL